MNYSLALSGRDYKKLRNHLFPGDGKEAVAVAVCGRQNIHGLKRLLVHELILVPYEDCSVRKPNLIKWSTQIIVPFLEKAAKKGMAILKIHSHPTGYPDFSETDDLSDSELFSSVYGWMDDEEPHASAIMLPDGKIFGRVFLPNMNTVPLTKVSIAGDDLQFWFDSQNRSIQDFELRTMQAFGEGTVKKLKQLTVGVVGCSGTGSPVIEQLVRLGVGELLLVDPDKVEKKNLNRIYNTTMNDAIKGKYKVDVLKNTIDRIGIGTVVSTSTENICDSPEIIRKLAACDVIFGCVDSIDGRNILNQIATFYLIPYFDLGVKLISDKKGGIDQILGTVHYIQPGGSSLRTRGVYTTEELRAASILRTDPEYYQEQKKSGYIVDVVVESPAVISINTQIASMAINDFLARIHPYKYDGNKEFAINRVSLTDSYYQHMPDGEPDEYLKKFVGRGDILPLLNTPGLN